MKKTFYVVDMKALQEIGGFTDLEEAKKQAHADAAYGGNEKAVVGIEGFFAVQPQVFPWVDVTKDE